MIGRKYAHVIWVACQGEAVRGYAFIKDHKILEIAFDPAYPQALRALAGPSAGRGPRTSLSRGDRLRPERSSGHRRGSRRHRAGSSTRMPTRGRSRCTTSPTWAGSSSASCPSWPAGRPSRAVALPLELGICAGRRALADPYRRQELARRAREAQPQAPDADAARPWSGC